MTPPRFSSNPSTGGEPGPSSPSPAVTPSHEADQFVQGGARARSTGIREAAGVGVTASGETAQARAAAPSVIDVLVVATPRFVDSNYDLPRVARRAVTETNRGFRRSGVHARLHLTSVEEVGRVETYRSGLALGRLIVPGDGYLDRVQALRDDDQADVVVLFTPLQDRCGRADIKATAATAYAVVWCASPDRYTFAHEIGHIFGARHNPQQDPSTHPYPYGHGYLHDVAGTTDDWRTIMSYPCPDYSCPRINYWSNPDKTYQGEPLGVPGISNNVRVLNERRATVAGFR